MKPDGYRNVHILSESTPYQLDAGHSAGTHLGAGILPGGRVVWIQDSSVVRSPGLRVPVYVEDLGLVFLDPHSYDAVKSTALRG